MATRTYEKLECPFWQTSSSGVSSAMMKHIVENLVALCPTLTLSEVVTNTTSVYKANLVCMNSEFRIQIYNSSSSIYIAILNSAGTLLISWAQSNMLNSYSDSSSGKTMYGANIVLQYSSIGGCLNAFRIGCASSSYCIDFRYAWAYSKALSRNLYFYGYGSSSSSGYATTSTGMDLMFSSTTYAYNPDTGKQESFSWASASHNAAYPIQYYSGAAYALTPCYTSGWLNQQQIWCGYLLWGGLYDIYLLYRSTGTVATVPETTYAIDGQTYLGCFIKMYILKPSIYT